MSEYTPERIIAELRRRANLPKDAPERAYLVGIRHLLTEAAEALEAATAGVVAEEPEWEGERESLTAEHWMQYGSGTTGGDIVPEFRGRRYASHERSVFAAEWMPVKQEGAET